MRLQRWQVRLAVGLFCLSLVFYALRWWLFPGSAEHVEMWRFLIGDIAFVFVQVLLVTLFIDRVIQARQRDEVLRKLNMVIGAFFSETGTSLLGELARADTAVADVRDQLVPTMTWKAEDYARARAAFHGHTPRIDLTSCDLARLKATLESKRSFLLGLLANESLLEHESFTDLLWALTHLGEELSARQRLDQMATADAAHIAADVKRAYRLLGGEWLLYLRHLQAQYPYLFSFAVRTNPLDPEARVEVVE